MAKWKDLNQFHPLAFANARWNGKTYSIPQTVEVRMINYHKDLFNEVGLDAERPPQSWEDLERAARKLTRVQDKKMTQRGYMWGWSNVNAAQEFGWFLMQNNGKLITDDARKPLFNNSLGIETLQFLNGLYQIAYPAGVASPQTPKGITAFAARQWAMVPGNYSLTKQVSDQAPEILGQVGAFIPRRSLAQKQVALSFINGLGIPSGAKYPDLAFEFIEMLASKEASQAFMSLSGFLSPRKDLASWVQDKYKTLVPWFEALEYIQPWPQVPGALAGYTTLGDEILKVLKGQIPPETALIQAERAQVNLFNDYWGKK
jgi:multiple sugar transport system substrate-binding protein